MYNNILKKTINLSRYISRLPSIVPFYDNDIDEWIEESENMSNYGKIVSDILLPDDIAVDMQTDINILLRTTTENDKEAFGDYYPIIPISETTQTDYGKKLYNIYSSINKIPDNIYVTIQENNGLVNLYKTTINENGINFNGIKERYVTFQTLMIWYHFFKKYYKLLYKLKCNGEYYTFTDSDNDNPITEDMKNYFNKLGGEKTYKWIIDNIIHLYEVNDNSIDFNYFPHYLSWSDILYQKEYINKQELSNDCCTKEKFLNFYGGEENLAKIKAWLNNQSKPSFNGQATKSASANIQICLRHNIDALGEYHVLDEEWIPGEEYQVNYLEGAKQEAKLAKNNFKEGDIVLYNYDSYRCIQSNSGTYNNIYHTIEFDNAFWESTYKDYIDNINQNNIFSNEENDDKCYGKTESKIYDFEDTSKTYDNLGNDMYGKYHMTDGKSYPNDGDILDINIHLYNTCNLDTTDVPYFLEDEKYYEAFGNIITKVEIYLKKYDGTKYMPHIFTFEENQKGYTEEIEKLFKIAKDNISAKEQEIDGNVYIEFNYVIGTTLKLTGTKDNCHYDIAKGHEQEGVFYIDEKILTKSPITYMLSSTASLLLTFYELQAIDYDIVRKYDDYYGKERDYELAKYYFYKTQNTANKGEGIDFDCPMVNLPLVMKDYKLGTVTKQNVESDVYVTRGKSSAFEKYIALSSIKTFEALENYQNGIFKIINSNK